MHIPIITAADLPAILPALPPASREAYATWKIADAVRMAHGKAEPAYPDFHGMTDAERDAASAAHQRATISYWRQHRELDAAAHAAFVAMAKTLPPIPKERRERGGVYGRPQRTRYIAAQAPTRFHEAYPFLCSYSEDTKTGEILSVGGSMFDEALPQAARHNAELDAYYAKQAEACGAAA